MGVYDSYGEVQLKTGPCILQEYHIGDEVDISDGLHFGYEGCVVVVGRKLVAVTDKMYDKWGRPIDVNIDSRNPITIAIKENL